MKLRIQGFNGVWTFDLAMLVWDSNQLSYQTTDCGTSVVILGANVLVMNEYMIDLIYHFVQTYLSEINVK